MPFFDGRVHFGSAFKEKLDLVTGMGNMDNGQCARVKKKNTGGFGERPSLKNDGERTFRKGSFRELCKYFKKSSY